MNPNAPAEIVLCPRCYCPLKMGCTYPVNLCIPALSLPSANHHGQPPSSGTGAHPPPPPEYQQDNLTAQPSEPPTNVQPSGREEDPATHGQRRSSTSSSSSFGSMFSELPNDAEFAASLQAVEDKYLSEQPTQGRTSSPLPASSPPPMSSPSTDFTLTLSSMRASSPSTESSVTFADSDEPPTATRRWVVFRGRVPGVYTSS